MTQAYTPSVCPPHTHTYLSLPFVLCSALWCLNVWRQSGGQEHHHLVFLLSPHLFNHPPNSPPSLPVPQWRMSGVCWTPVGRWCRAVMATAVPMTLTLAPSSSTAATKPSAPTSTAWLGTSTATTSTRTCGTCVCVTLRPKALPVSLCYKVKSALMKGLLKHENIHPIGSVQSSCCI